MIGVLAFSNHQKGKVNQMTATITAPQTERITLYYREGSSDKVYQASIEPAGELFVVNFAFGRRGSTLNTGTKTQTAVDYDTAARIFTKLVNEKKAKGYTQGPDGTPYQHTAKEDRVTGFLPQLLNPINEHEANLLLKDPVYAMQEKFDGRRMLVRKNQAEVHGINRKGLLIGLPETVFGSIRSIPGNFVLDGECLGDLFCAFDLLGQDGQDLRTESYQHRLVELMGFPNRSSLPHIRLVETAIGQESKERLLQRLKTEKREGVVFKRLDAPYTPGRPNSGGPQLKHKFYATCSAVVSKLNDKRSVELRLLNGMGWNQIGNVTIPVNFQVPEVGQIVEIRYLYAFKESNALYQPVYLGPRKDVELHECVLSQLKYKAGESEES
jgi:bifunctional non-homologous end joining protein LigD